MSVRLNKVTKECNVGLQTIVDFLHKKGFDDVEANPSARITDEQYALVQAEFNKDKGVRSQIQQMQAQVEFQSTHPMRGETAILSKYISSVIP